MFRWHSGAWQGVLWIGVNQLIDIRRSTAATAESSDALTTVHLQQKHLEELSAVYFVEMLAGPFRVRSSLFGVD